MPPVLPNCSEKFSRRIHLKDIETRVTVEKGARTGKKKKSHFSLQGKNTRANPDESHGYFRRKIIG